MLLPAGPTGPTLVVRFPGMYQPQLVVRGKLLCEWVHPELRQRVS
jgi:hypothetical protein